MLRLVFSAEPFWIDLVGAARVQVLPFTSSVLGRAQAIGRRDKRPLPLAQDEAVQEHFNRFSVAMACAAITEWEGIGDQDGEVLPITPETVAGVMSIPACSEAFKLGYMVKAMEILAEKKAFAPSQNGTSAAVRLTAVPAATSAKPVPLQ